MTTIFYIFLILTIIRLIYWAFFFYRIGNYQSSNDKSLPQGVSIIVCAKNEFNNLSRLIPILLNQDFRNFELIIVDDYSDDDTHLLKTQFPEIKWIVPESNHPGKKIALNAGINAAKHEILLLTDADCEPTPYWIAAMAAQIADNDIVLGYSPMLKSDSCLGLNTFSRFETLMTALQYIGYAMAKLPYMGVGRNMLYRKSLFYKVGGFNNHMDILSGDDDLFIQDVVSNKKQRKIGIALATNSYVSTWSPTSWKSYFNQKRRHASTSTKYTLHHQLLLSIWAMSHIGWVVVFLIYAIGLGRLDIILVGIIFWILATILHYKSIIRLKGGDLILRFPILDIGLGVNYIIVGLLLLKDKITKRQAWT